MCWWLIPWAVVAWIAVALILLATGVLVVMTWQDSVPGSVRQRGELKSLPLTLASIVQAHEALWDPENSDYPSQVPASGWWRCSAWTRQAAGRPGVAGVDGAAAGPPARHAQPRPR